MIEGTAEEFNEKVWERGKTGEEGTGGGFATEHTEGTEERKGREGESERKKEDGGRICTRRDTEDTDGKGEEKKDGMKEKAKGRGKVEIEKRKGERGSE